MKTQAFLCAVLLMCSACVDEADSQPVDPSGSDGPARGGKGDVIVSVDQCLAYFEQDELCPETDRHRATLEELDASVACLEGKAAAPEAACCLKDELKGHAYCVVQSERSAQVFCESYQDNYQDCALNRISNPVTCQQSYAESFNSPNFNCCDRMDSVLCDTPTINRLESLDDLVDPIFAVGGHAQISSLSSQISHVDIMPSTLQDSIAFLQNNEVSDYLDRESFGTYTLKEQLPVQYAVHNFFPGYGPNIKPDADGVKLRDVAYSPVDAYLSYWRTTDDRIVLATHYLDYAVVTQSPGYGWVTGPTFVLPESVCDLIDVSAASQSTLLAALDEVAGHVDQSCVKESFSALDVSSEQVSKLGASLFYALNSHVGEDSRLNHVSEAYEIKTPFFEGYMLYLDEVLTPEDEAFRRDNDLEDLPLVMQRRVVLNVHGEVIGHYDDDACEYEGDAFDTICGRNEFLNP